MSEQLEKDHRGQFLSKKELIQITGGRKKKRKATDGFFRGLTIRVK